MSQIQAQGIPSFGLSQVLSGIRHFNTHRWGVSDACYASLPLSLGREASAHLDPHRVAKLLSNVLDDPWEME